MIYLDNAASSWPKPPEVIEAVTRCISETGANPGRGSHQMAVKASRILFECRKNLAALFNVPNPNDISFTLNTTMALNQAILGFVKPGQHVICTAVEHNSVRRPLEYLKKKIGIDVTYIPADSTGCIHLAGLREAFRKHTSLFVCSHSSNLLGSILPVGDIAEICKKRGVRLLVDAAQTAGHFPVDVKAMNIDMLAFPGHKGLFGPQGTGGLYISPEVELEPLLLGGTGSQSERVEQPSVRPDRYESGTQNTPGIAGLNEGVKFVLNETVDKIHNIEWKLTQRLMEGLSEIPGVRILGPALGEPKTGIVSFVLAGMDSAQVAFILDQTYQIAVRSGYHCTPLAHETVGTLETGAVRASVSCFTKEEEIDLLIQAIKEIANQYSA